MLTTRAVRSSRTEAMLSCCKTCFSLIAANYTEIKVKPDRSGVSFFVARFIQMPNRISEHINDGLAEAVHVARGHACDVDSARANDVDRVVLAQCLDLLFVQA